MMVLNFKQHYFIILNLRWYQEEYVPTPQAMINGNDAPPRGPPNTVKDGICQNCSKQEVEEFVSCLFCKIQFHMNGCFENSDDDILSNSDAKSFYKAIQKSGKFGIRPGNFRFICDPCITDFENKQTCTTNDSVQILDKRVTNLSEDVTAIKEMLTTIAGKNPSTPTAAPNNDSNQASANHNVWQDKDRVKSLLVVHKDVALCKSDIEKSVMDNGLQVSSQFVNKKGDQVFVLPSQSAREKLKHELVSSGIPIDKVAEPKQKYPAISVVGIPSHFDKDSKESLFNTLLKQNPGIVDLVRKETSVFEILMIKPLRKNPNIKQAIIRLSDDIRLTIKNSGERLFCCMSSCRVYDQLYIKRCNKCQDFGHYAKECTGAACCGICASSNHETSSCPYRENPDESVMCCINCKKTDSITDHKHLASSTSCPTYLAKQEKLKSSIPYYGASKN